MEDKFVTSPLERGAAVDQGTAVTQSERVIVGLSGGVDSSLAAALLQEQGHDVVGVTLHLWDAEGEERVGRCCAPEDRDDARRTCEALGIPHYVMDAREAFLARVVDPFVAEKLSGRTPLPCAACNQEVKLARLASLAQTFGATRIATGHYARVRQGPDGRSELLRGADSEKDQSYFLFGLSEALLARMVFPLGEMTKREARDEARRRRLPNADKPDSQELCFVPDGDTAAFLARRGVSRSRSGPITDESGRVLGAHQGVEAFTVGQRRGLGVSAGEPRYVLRIVAEEARVVVGPHERSFSSELCAEGASWIAPTPRAPFAAAVRVRHRHEPAPAWITPTEGGFRAAFREPQRAVAPGQAAVVYDGERVVGGGTIAA